MMAAGTSGIFYVRWQAEMLRASVRSAADRLHKTLSLFVHQSAGWRVAGRFGFMRCVSVAYV